LLHLPLWKSTHNLLLSIFIISIPFHTTTACKYKRSFWLIYSCSHACSSSHYDEYSLNKHKMHSIYGDISLLHPSGHHSFFYWILKWQLKRKITFAWIKKTMDKNPVFFTQLTLSKMLTSSSSVNWFHFFSFYSHNCTLNITSVLQSAGLYTNHQLLTVMLQQVVPISVFWLGAMPLPVTTWTEYNKEHSAMPCQRQCWILQSWLLM
jgi:hypothetical protein